MDKLVYILWDSRGQNKAQRQQTLLKEVAPRLLQAGALQLSMYIVDDDANVRSPAPFHAGERMCAEVAIWLNDAGNTRRVTRSSRKQASDLPDIWWTSRSTPNMAVTGTLLRGVGLMGSVPPVLSP